MGARFDPEKLEKTLAVYDEYERRFAAARAARIRRRPWCKDDRESILSDVREILKYDDSMIPDIRILDTETQHFRGIEVQHMLFESYEKFYGISSLFIPAGGGTRPLILICPGHGEFGRLTPAYQSLAATLAESGAYVLLSDNIGQGSRKPFGHTFVPEAFYAGKTLQGFLVAETVGWIRYMMRQPYVDSARIGACGNSGGGTLTEFLSALAPELAAIASTGYPSEFGYILQKERRHCDCNLLSGFASRIDMWEVYSLFAPKPLFLEVGKNDDLIPFDLFQRNARKVSSVYHMLGKPDAFRAVTTPTPHPWQVIDMKHIADFFADTFGLARTAEVALEPLMTHDEIHLPFPADARDTGDMIRAFTGLEIPRDLPLSAIVPPTFEGMPLDPDTIIPDLGRGDLMRVFAQFEYSLR